MTSAKVIKHSITEEGQEILTMELEYPRMVHSELMTHRIFSKNSASSRAIPVMTMIKSIWDSPAGPVHWGKNQGGMSAREELDGWKLDAAKLIWALAAKTACSLAWLMAKLGVHKQIANRITEPFSYIKVLVTSTSWDNFDALRRHPDAQPEIQLLAEVIYEARQNSVPQILKEGEWHLPYIVDIRTYDSLETAIKVSSSMCAQTSYRKANDSVQKALDIYSKLVGGIPLHASPFEHQATPLTSEDSIFFTHKDKLGRLWSGNFCGWGQNRQKIQSEMRLETMTAKVL